MHLLRALRRGAAAERVSQLRWWVRPEARPAVAQLERRQLPRHGSGGEQSPASSRRSGRTPGIRCAVDAHTTARTLIGGQPASTRLARPRCPGVTPIAVEAWNLTSAWASTGPCILLEVCGENACQDLLEVCGWVGLLQTGISGAHRRLAGRIGRTGFCCRRGHRGCAPGTPSGRGAAAARRVCLGARLLPLGWTPARLGGWPLVARAPRLALASRALGRATWPLSLRTRPLGQGLIRPERRDALPPLPLSHFPPPLRRPRTLRASCQSSSVASSVISVLNSLETGQPAFA
jgi:hypothetical protein